jgi:hypothetical protein
MLDVSTMVDAMDPENVNPVVRELLVEGGNELGIVVLQAMLGPNLRRSWVDFDMIFDEVVGRIRGVYVNWEKFEAGLRAAIPKLEDQGLIDIHPGATEEQKFTAWITAFLSSPNHIDRLPSCVPGGKGRIRVPVFYTDLDEFNIRSLQGFRIKPEDRSLSEGSRVDSGLEPADSSSWNTDYSYYYTRGEGPWMVADDPLVFSDDDDEIVGGITQQIFEVRAPFALPTGKYLEVVMEDGCYDFRVVDEASLAPDKVLSDNRSNDK